MVVNYFVETLKSTKVYQTNKKYRLLINSFSFLFFTTTFLIILRTRIYIWLDILTIPILFGVPIIATIYLDNYLNKKFIKKYGKYQNK